MKKLLFLLFALPLCCLLFSCNTNGNDETSSSGGTNATNTTSSSEQSTTQTTQSAKTNPSDLYWDGSQFTIEGYDVDHMSYNPKWRDFYFASARFLDGLEHERTEGSVSLWTSRWEGDWSEVWKSGRLMRVSFTVSAKNKPPGTGTLSGPHVEFIYDRQEKTVQDVKFTPYEFDGSTFTLTQEQMLAIGRKLSDIIEYCETYGVQESSS